MKTKKFGKLENGDSFYTNAGIRKGGSAMAENLKRTDLALEAREIAMGEAPGQSGEPDGVKCDEYEKNGYPVTRVEVLDERGEAAIGKPRGVYITIELHYLIRREQDAFPRGAKTIAHELRELVPRSGTVLVAGLGNRGITPDAVGTKTAEHVMVTRHLVSRVPQYFGDFRPVAAVTPGVLGITGVETAEIIRGVTERVAPACIIVIDALASRRLSRLCSTVQISNTGITPGSGVGNAAAEITEKSLGVPVIAIGVPTVVDAATLALDIAQEAGVPDLDPQELLKSGGSLIVTPKDIDRYMSDAAKIIGYGINLALHDGIDLADIDMFLS